MGQGQSVFDEKQLSQYQDCTYFTRKEILSLYRRFSGLNPEKISPHKANVTTRLSFAEVQDMPELRENPFRARMCEVFSTDGRGLHFEDFLDLFSVFSVHAPWDLKATYAFRVYDFNGDAAICKDDIKRVLECLTGEPSTMCAYRPCCNMDCHENCGVRVEFWSGLYQVHPPKWVPIT